MMDKDNLFYLCNRFYILTQYPLTIFHKGEPVYSCENSLEYSPIPALAYPLMQSHSDFESLWFGNAILAIHFPVKQTQMSIFIGPLLTKHMKKTDMITLLSDNRPPLSYECIHNLERYLAKSKPTDMNIIFNYIDFLYAAINQTPPDSTQIPSFSSSGITENKMIEGIPIETIETFYSQENAKYVEKLSYLVEHGMVEELNEFIMKDNELPYGKLGPNVLRHQKNSCIISTYIVRKAAQTGGLDETICLRLAEGYTQRFEFASSTFEISKISREMRRDYCQRVHELQKIQVNHPVITQAMNYIHNHRMDKLDASIISDSIGISYSYFCSLSKKETGISLIDYIQKEKVDAAKTLLSFSDYTLSQISEQLSFSSQSYFQSVFKKVTGITPLEYKVRMPAP